MNDVRTSHLQELLNRYKDKKLGTVVKIRIALKQLFEAAEIEGIIDRNPAAKLELPEVSESVRRPLNDIERSVVYEVAQTHKCGAYILTLMFCGLRRGECVALKVGDVDLENKKITVNKSLNLRKNIGVEKGTKTKAGIREVPIPDILLPFIIISCKGRDKKAVLFPKTDGHHATNQTCRWWWKSFLRQCHMKAGAKLCRNRVITETSPFDNKITPHFLRHTYATDLYSAGVDEKAQKYFLGHASSEVTDVYRKMSETAFIRARDKLNEYYASIDFEPGKQPKLQN